MEYRISYDMAIELLRFYLEKIYRLDKHKNTAPEKIQELYNLNSRLRMLLHQLREAGHDTDFLVGQIKEELEPKYQYQNLQVYVDGAARGNDTRTVINRSGVAFVLYGDGQRLYGEAKYLGNEIELPYLEGENLACARERTIATNNVSEYVAFIEALEYLLREDYTAKRIDVYSDSQQMVKQVNMLCATKAPHLRRLRDCCKQLLGKFENITLHMISREENEEADRLVNKLLDSLEILEELESEVQVGND